MTSRKELAPDPQELVVRIFREYAPEVDASRWPWETARWFELVFCILTAIGEPQVPAAATREITNTLSRQGLLDVSALASWQSATDEAQALRVTLDTLLRRAGFSPEQAAAAVRAIGEAAANLQRKYDAKVQNCLRKYGQEMLARIHDDLGFSQFEAAHKALALWLQNTLNMPIPASNPLADAACESLGIAYEALVEAAVAQDINVALLDDALRSYWESEAAERGFQQPAV